jgi:hypothetical protein
MAGCRTAHVRNGSPASADKEQLQLTGHRLVGTRHRLWVIFGRIPNLPHQWLRLPSGPCRTPTQRVFRETFYNA